MKIKFWSEIDQYFKCWSKSNSDHKFIHSLLENIMIIFWSIFVLSRILSNSIKFWSSSSLDFEKNEFYFDRVIIKIKFWRFFDRQIFTNRWSKIIFSLKISNQNFINSYQILINFDSKNNSFRFDKKLINNCFILNFDQFLIKIFSLRQLRISVFRKLFCGENPGLKAKIS